MTPKNFCLDLSIGNYVQEACYRFSDGGDKGISVGRVKGEKSRALFHFLPNTVSLLDFFCYAHFFLVVDYFFACPYQLRVYYKHVGVYIKDGAYVLLISRYSDFLSRCLLIQRYYCAV